MNLQEWINRDNSLKKDGILLGTRHTQVVNSDGFIEVYGKLYKNIVCPPANSYIELNNYRKYVPVIMQYVESEAAEIDRLYQILRRANDDSKEKSHKRWTEQEDNLLIELICKDESMLNISTSLGRSASAISSRLSYLVGVKRISTRIAGKFIGEINGEQTEAELNGTVYKE